MKTTMILENEFIEQLFITQSDNDIKNDFYNFIISDFSGYNLVCDFNNFDEYTQAVHENPIWELILDKIDKVSFNSTLNSDIENDEFYATIGEHNIFLTTFTQDKCAKLSKEKGYLYLSDGNIEEVWDNFTSEKRNNVFKVSNSEIIPENYKFNSWSKIDSFCAPLTSVLIFDKYILNDSSGQKMVHNLFPLFERLIQNTNKSTELTVTIVCEPNNYCIEQRQKQLNAFFKAKGYVSVKVNIVKHFKAFYPRNFEGLHGRVIYTNYYHIRCDDSFNLFNHTKVNNDADIKINFSLSSVNRCFYEKELKDLKKYISKLSNNEKSPKEEHKLVYFPDKNNYLLN